MSTSSQHVDAFDEGFDAFNDGKDKEDKAKNSMLFIFLLHGVMIFPKEMKKPPDENTVILCLKTGCVLR